MRFHGQGQHYLLGILCVGLFLGSIGTGEAQRTTKKNQSSRSSGDTEERQEQESSAASRPKSAFLKAVEAGDVARAKSLLDQGASLRQTDSLGRAALHLAIAHVPMVRLLLENKANVNAIDTKGRTPLILSAIGGYIGTVEELVKAEARIDVRDSKGCTALACAVLNRRPRTVALLIANGANVHIQDNQGRTPRDMAREVNDPQILKMLEAAVANPNPVKPKPRPGEVMEPTNPRDTSNQKQPPPSTVDKTPFLRYAQDLFTAVGEESERSKVALRYFEGLSVRQLQQEAESLRKNQTRGSFGYKSLSYVLAYFGVDVTINVQRVMYDWLYPDVFNDENRPRQTDKTAEAIKQIYARNPSDDLLAKVMLVVRQNRVTTEEPALLLADLFTQYPVATLRATTQRGSDSREASLTALAKVLEGYVGSKRLDKIFKTLSQSRERGIASTAQDLQAEIDSIRKN